jgi:hypothetical protein
MDETKQTTGARVYIPDTSTKEGVALLSKILGNYITNAEPEIEREGTDQG